MISVAVLSLVASVSFHGGVSLVSSRTAVRPGESFEVAVRISLDPGWHTYWQNPGDAGIPPAIKWKLPAGWSVGPIQWPMPKKLISTEVVSYGYEHEALLFAKVTAPASPSSKVAHLRAHVDWLVCREGCIPANGDVSADLAVGGRSVQNPHWASGYAQQLAIIPRPSKDDSLIATRTGSTILLSIPKIDVGPIKQVYFFSSEPMVDPSAPQLVQRSAAGDTVQLTVSPYASPSVSRLRGLLVTVRGTSTTSENIDIPIRRKTS